MTTFKVQKIKQGYNITMIINEHEYGIYKYCDTIINYLQIDPNDLNEALKLYDGKFYILGMTVKDVILIFTTKEKANTFVNEYLEPLLIVKELSN